jgi:hypothetical protein
MIYKDSKYIYPPRPERTFPRSGMDTFDNDVYMAQPKFDGDCTEVYIGENLWKVMNRHKKESSKFKLKKDEIKNLILNKGSNVFVGEYLDKSRKNEFGKVFNDKLIIFDILVLNNEHLIGKTFQERMNILTDMFTYIDENDYSYKLSDNIYLTKTFYKGFGELWDKFVQIDMLEGLVLKRKDAGLEPGTTEKNNVLSQLKCRKETKNYSY